MANPIKRPLQYERTKQCKINNEIKNDIIKKPVGRPREYNINCYIQYIKYYME